MNPQFSKLSEFCHERRLPFWPTLYEAQRGYLWDKVPGGREIISFRTRHAGNNRRDKATRHIFLHWKWDRYDMTMEQASENAIEYFFQVIERQDVSS